MKLILDWGLVTMTGSTIVSTTGWIKTLLEIRKIQRELQTAKKKADSTIYIPESTEERIRYGSTRLHKLIVIAAICGLVSLASAAVAIPAMAAKLAALRQLQSERDSSHSERKPVRVASPEKLVLKHQIPAEAQTTKSDDIVMDPAPDSNVAGIQSPSVISGATPPSGFTESPEPPRSISSLNDLFLKGVGENDYKSIKQLLAMGADYLITDRKIKKWHDDIYPLWIAEKRYKGSIKDEDKTIHIWLLRLSDQDRTRVMETLVVSKAERIHRAYLSIDEPLISGSKR